jgi:hypothetical protein
MFNRTFAAVLLSLFVPSFAYAAESDDAAKTTDSGNGGYGLVSDVTSKGVEKPISLGYGGLRLGFILGEKDDRFHFGAAALFGAAGMGVGDTSTTAWVMEPEVNADVSALRWLRVGVSGGYRFMIPSSNNDANLAFKQMSGLCAGIQFKFGSF